MLNRKISKKQQEILDFIKHEQREHGYPPSVREICEAVQLKSTSSVHAHLESLERNGFIRRNPTKPRAIELIEETFQLPKRELVNVPIITNEEYVIPLLSQKNICNYFPLPAEYVTSSECFFWQVQDDTMKNVGIFSGSYVLIDQAQTLREGDLAIILHEDHLSVRTYCMENGIFYFKTETDVALPTFSSSESMIIGKVEATFYFYPHSIQIQKEDFENKE